MKNYIQRGDTLPLIAPAAVASGGVVIVGGFVGVAATAAASGAEVETHLRGVFTLPKAAGAITQGAAVYWDTTPGEVTTTASGNTAIGHAVAAAADAATTVNVRLPG